MTLSDFAMTYSLKLRRDPGDDTDIIPGRRGKSHIYDYGDGHFGVMMMPETGASHLWTSARRAFKAAGMDIVQNGDDEGAAIFDPTNPEQVRVALRHADVRPRRGSSDKQVAAFSKAREMATRNRTLQNPVHGAVLAPRNDDCGSGQLLCIPSPLDVLGSKNPVCTEASG